MRIYSKIILIVGLSLTLTNVSKAQLDFDSFLEAGIADANTLLQSYLEPAFQGFGYGINSGWYNTARPHKTLGFDLNITASAAIIPSSSEFFTFNNSDYTNVRLSNGTSAQLPTLFGPNLGADDLPELTFFDNSGNQTIRISAPTGLGAEEEFSTNAVPTPMIQLGIGLIKGTDLKIRFVPDLSFGDTDEVSVQLFGLGIMHDIKQHIPVIKSLPFDLSVFAGFTNLKTTYVVDADLNQTAEFETKGTLVQALVSKKLAFVTAYGGIGYAKSTTTFGLLGQFSTETNTFNNPIDLAYENSGMRANVGLRLRLLFLNIFGEYAFQQFNTVTVGIGFSFREGSSTTNIPIVPGI
ncbi:MAG: hypothetical protein ACI9Z3_000669 [Roseivirga sp.]|jgi:hypothetical protein